MDPDDPRIRAAAEWLRSDDSAYEIEPDFAIRAARGMLAAADAVDPLRSSPTPRSSIRQFDTDETIEFTTLAELFAIPFVEDFQSDPSFHRFSLEKYGTPALLMAEFDAGRRWLAIGLISGPQPDLPAWEPVCTAK